MTTELHSAAAPEPAPEVAADDGMPWPVAALTVALTIFAVLFASFVAVATGLV